MKRKEHDVILSVKGLTKSYGDLTAVQDLSLDIFHGEVFGFLGPNGAGKTTAISMICGLLKRDRGEIVIAGHSLENHYRQCKRLIGLCPQDLVIWESLTCVEQLELLARLYDVGKGAARKRALELLEILGLEKKKDKQAKTLSGGMKRRLNIALALVHEPEILILDEPQAGLDPQSRIMVREYIRSLANHITVILTTHDMDEADRLADRIAIIDHGRLLVLDTPANLKEKIGQGDILEIQVPGGQEESLNRLLEDFPGNLGKPVYRQGTLRVVSNNILDKLPGLLEKFHEKGVGIEGMTMRKKTLEDVFIALTGRGLRE
ncbi:MAG: ABC transporter ATP-binding protein [bacterium]|nr:ABC transporter ATP-binding protein [bacterium]